jgi:Fur family ferric uptake transcriptional regulator
MPAMDLVSRLRERGLRLTAQRRVVAQALAGAHVHLTAEEVHARAAALLPEISRATVYNTLAELVAAGEIQELVTDGRSKRYDPNAREPHQHLVCQGCGLVRDVHPAGESALALPSRERHGFAVQSVDIIFRGLCPACRQSSEPRRRARARSSR